MTDLPLGDVLEETWERFVASPADFLILAFLATAAPLVVNALIMFAIDPELLHLLGTTGGTGGALGGVVAFLQAGLMSTTGAELGPGTPPTQTLLTGTVSLVVGTVLGALFGGALVAEALFEPRDAGPVASLRVSLDHLIPLVVAAIVIGLISLALLLPGFGLLMAGLATRSLVVVGTGVLAMVLGFVAAVYVLIALYVWRVVIIDEDAGAVEGLKRSWEMTQGNRLNVFLVVLVIGLITGVVATVTQMPFLLAGGVGLGSGDPVSFGLVPAIGIVLAGTVTGAFAPIASVRVHAHLSGRTGAADEAEEPGPSPPEGYVPVEPGG